MHRVVGLELDATAARAVELDGGGEVRRFAEVALPEGAMAGGEVLDVPAVTEALRRLWAEGGFASKHVVVAPVSPRVVLRHARLPRMERADLRDALRFELAEVLPFPAPAAVIDALPAPTDDDLPGQPVEVLVAAADGPAVDAVLAAVTGAGLHVVEVGLAPLALLAAAAATLDDPGEPGAIDAVVHVGQATTTLVLHEAGRPRLLRVLGVGSEPQGGQDDLGAELARLESFRQRLAGAADVAQMAPPDVDTARLRPLVEGVRASFDYYRTQPGSRPLRRVWLSGPASSARGLREQLTELVTVPVELVGEVATTGAAALGFLDGVRPSFVATGLALAGSGSDAAAGTPWLSLLPPTVLAQRKRRRDQRVAVGAVVATAAVLGALTAFLGMEVTHQEDLAADAEVASAGAQAQLGAGASTMERGTLLLDGRRAYEAATAGRTSWEDVVRALQSASTGVNTLLGSVTGSVVEGEGGRVVELQVQGLAADHATVGEWMVAVGDTAEMEPPTLLSSRAVSEDNPAVVFQATVQVSGGQA